MTWKVPSPVEWVRRHPGTTEEGRWHGPHGPLNWTRHRVVGARRNGVVLMVHGYKGFRRWGNWFGVAHKLVEAGWEVVRLDFSHNGHLAPFDGDCLDEEAWSANRYHMEVDEVEFGLAQLSKECEDPVVVFGHSRGGAIAALGAAQHQRSGGKLSGVSMWSPVSDLFSRFPSGKELEEWEARGFVEVVNGRTGQVLHHPFDFFSESQSRKELLDVQNAITSLSCEILVVHGDADEVIMPFEGKRIAGWAKSGSYELIEGGNHVFGMSHPWPEAREQPPALSAALRAQNQWLNHLLSSAGGE
ncbi:MAG: alpha/beta fold hydrolase [Bacteroidetes bacterium]|nr:alpha/beta fold hydrolase [Bacteroidota bacterium]